MTITKAQLSDYVWHRANQLKMKDYYNLYVGGGALYFDTGDSHTYFALGEEALLKIAEERPVGRWVSVALDTTQCDPRLTFPLDYFEDAMWDEYKHLRGELGDALDELIEELYDRVEEGVGRT